MVYSPDGWRHSLSGRKLTAGQPAPIIKRIRFHCEVAMFADQSACTARFEWGQTGLDAVAPGCAAIIIVDVLSFSTCIDIATARGAAVLPYPWRNDAAAEFAAANGAVLASRKRVVTGGYSLSPASLVEIPAGTRLVLPSRNGAVQCLHAAHLAPTLTACLRNCVAVAEHARGLGGPIAVIASGERWPDDTMRAAWEDLIGAGAVLAHLPGPHSPEARTAIEAFIQAEPELPRLLRECASGRELREHGFAEDVELAAQCGVSNSVPILEGVAFVSAVGVSCQGE